MEGEEKKEVEKVETPVLEEKKEPLQDKKQDKRTRMEKLLYTMSKIQSQIEEEKELNGISLVEDEDDSKTLTLGDLKRRERDNAKKTALQMADELSEDERDEVKDIINTRIVPTGNPQRDYQTALDLVHSEKNRQIAEEAARKRATKSVRPSDSGAPARQEEEFIPTEVELAAAAMVGKKSKEDIKVFVLKARAKESN